MHCACCHLLHDSHCTISWPSHSVELHTQRVPLSEVPLLTSVVGEKRVELPEAVALVGVSEKSSLKGSKSGAAWLRSLLHMSADAFHRSLCASRVCTWVVLTLSAWGQSVDRQGEWC